MIPKFTLPCIVNTADISHGSSGGALVNTKGHVVGVTTGAYEGGNNLYISIPWMPSRRQIGTQRASLWRRS